MLLRSVLLRKVIGMSAIAHTAASQFRQRIRRTARRRLSFLSVPARKICQILDDRETIVYRGYPIPPRYLRSRMCGEAFRSDDFYLKSAVVEATRLSTRLGYTKSSRLVDVGCGLGRLATGMLEEFGEVAYFGLDANRQFIEWCRENIESHHPNFRFIHLDVKNQLYNPDGTLDGIDIKLPIASAAADIVYLWGVFTNMEPQHVEIYTSELSRIARKDGKIFLTAFVEEEVPNVSVNPAGYVPFGCTAPLSVVRYNKQWLFSLFSRHRMIVDEFRYHGGMFPKESEIYLTNP
jgi:SAM-dependent methyltransferase